jgi:hypothetical protein
MEVTSVPEKWYIYNLHPKGKDVPAAHLLNDARLHVEKILKDLPACEWFTLLYKPCRVKFGFKAENPEGLITAIEAELRDPYRNRHLEPVPDENKEDAETCERYAIAAQCRMVLQEKGPSEWTLDWIVRVLHLMLNPVGYYQEAQIYQQAFLGALVSLCRSFQRGS